MAGINSVTYLSSCLLGKGLVQIFISVLLHFLRDLRVEAQVLCEYSFLVPT
jgi:hypothetical protein